MRFRKRSPKSDANHPKADEMLAECGLSATIQTQF
jgi:hypothetical protein